MSTPPPPLPDADASNIEDLCDLFTSSPGKCHSNSARSPIRTTASRLCPQKLLRRIPETRLFPLRCFPHLLTPHPSVVFSKPTVVVPHAAFLQPTNYQHLFNNESPENSDPDATTHIQSWKPLVLARVAFLSGDNKCHILPDHFTRIYDGRCSGAREEYLLS